MKKLLIYLSSFFVFIFFLSATPCSCLNTKKISKVKAVALTANFSQNDIQTDNLEIHPLNILDLRFR